MAIFHLKSQIISRTAGRGIIAAAAYRSGKKIFEERSQTYYDFSNRTGIVHTEIMAPLCAPDWVYDRRVLWNAVDITEKRKDAQLARELMVALPKELSLQHYIELVRSFVIKNFVKEGMIADFAIHAPSTKKGGVNYHAHILLTQRSISLEGFGQKVRQWNRIFFLYQWRQAWAEETNRLLELEGFECRIDHRSRATKEWELAQQLEMQPPEVSMTMADKLLSFEQDDVAIVVNDPTEEIVQSDAPMDDSDGVLSSSLDEIDRQQSMTIAQNIGSAELLAPSFNLMKIQEHRIALKNLLGLKNSPQLLLEDRAEAFEQLKQRFKSHQERISVLCQRLPDGGTKDWLAVLYRLEAACFNQYGNQIQADMLEEKNAEEHALDIAFRRHLADVERQNHLRCINEWHYHGVTDDRYLPLTQNAKERIDQVKNQFQNRLTELHSTAQRQHWKPERLDKEIEQLKQSLDQQCKDLFDLEKSRIRERSISR